MSKMMEDVMRIDKPGHMEKQAMERLGEIKLAPYIEIATLLVSKGRRAGGNMFRHQLDTLAILIEYGYIDAILLKASVIHDVLEDIKDFDQNIIKKCDSDGEEVLKLVLEVSRQQDETKADFLKRIIEHGSFRAKLLKCADRISNMISLGFVTDASFIDRTANDTEAFVLPMALLVDYSMYTELISLLETRQRYLETIGFYTN